MKPTNQTTKSKNNIYKWIIYVQFKGAKKAYTFGSNIEYRPGDQVVVETIRGKEIGTVCVPAMTYSPKKAKGILKPVIRKADDQDLHQQKINEIRAKEAFRICQLAIERHELDMHLISCEYTLDGNNVLFTYHSDNRVDFRALLKELTNEIEGRVELRQIGPRHKAKLIGGVGVCGMECCCSRYLNSFETVTINMAKNQLVSLNTSKLSGQCGKLKCCLAYENDTYTEAKQDLPRVGSIVSYNGKPHKLTNLNIFQEEARLEGPDGPVVVPFEELRNKRYAKN